MVKVYYGNDYKETAYGTPLYTNSASAIASYQKNYQFVIVEDITYQDIKYMSDEKRLQLYEEETGIKLSKVNDEFWNWVEENYL